MNLTQKMALICQAYLDGEPQCDDAVKLRQNLVMLFKSAGNGELVVFANHNEHRELTS